MNDTFDDIGDEITGSIPRDGSAAATANLPMATFKHTNVGNATALNQYAATGQVQNSAFHTLSNVAGTNAVTGDLTPALQAYTNGLRVNFKPANANTSDVTISINGLGAVNVYKATGDTSQSVTELVAGDLITGFPAEMIYNGSAFILFNPQSETPPLVWNSLISNNPPFERTAAEIAASVTPVNYAYLPGDIRRYGTNTTPGTTDMTTAIANALLVSASHRLVFQPETYLTGKQTVPSGADIYMPPGCLLKDSGVLGASERLINITNDNIHIVGWGAKIQMTRADYTTGEQRHGVNIRDAENITIEGLESSDSGGDGFYIGGDSGPSINVRLVGCKADNNRRQGLSVVSARKVRVIDFQATNTTGTEPAYGIDVEPNDTDDVMEDIKIIRPRCVGNDGAGIGLFFGTFNSADKYVDVEIIEPYTNDNGKVSISGSRRPGIEVNRCVSTTPCRGRIRIVDATCVDENTCGIRVIDWDVNGPLVEIIRPAVYNPNQDNQSTPSTAVGGIILHNSTSHTSAPGNVRIIDPLIRDDDGFLNSNSFTVLRVSGVWDQVLVTNPKYAYAGTNPWSIDGTVKSVRIISEPEITAAVTGNTTISDGRYLGRTITNAGASGSLTVTLPQTTSAMVGHRYPFEVFAAQTMGVSPNAADVITPLAAGYAAGTFVKSTVRGSRLVLECKQVGYWHVVEQSGIWAIDPGAGTPPTYTVANPTTDRALDVSGDTTAQGLAVLGTLLNDLKERGILR